MTALGSTGPASGHASVRTESPNHDPDVARLVTADVSHFWRAMDRTAGEDGDAPVHALREFYLRPASAGLRDWIRLRLRDGGALEQALEREGWSPARVERARALPRGDAERRACAAAVSAQVERIAAEQLARTIAARSRFYASTRAATLAIGASSAVLEPLRACFRQLAALHPGAVFPDVYFVIGRLTTGGTIGPTGILIGAEMFGRGSETPLDELTAWERCVIRSPDALVRTVMHELAHCQQPPARSSATLLEQALREGAADFVASILTRSSAGGTVRHAYGMAHERALWAEFRRVMHGRDWSGWLYQGDRAADRPADLGYFVGLRICQAYHQRAGGTPGALHRILTFDHAGEFLCESGYAEQLADTRGPIPSPFAASIPAPAFSVPLPVSETT